MTERASLPPDVIVASVMICGLPKLVGHRLLVSASDSVWEPLAELPDEIQRHLTDEVGNPPQGNPPRLYAGAVQIADTNALEEVKKLGAFACFRAVHDRFAGHVQTCPPSAIYAFLQGGFVHLGWDICVGNGWVSASTEGDFPLDGLSGRIEPECQHLFNEWSLLGSLDDARHYCELNDQWLPSDAPWYPVSVCVDERSYGSLEALRQF